MTPVDHRPYFELPDAVVSIPGPSLEELDERRFEPMELRGPGTVLCEDRLAGVTVAVAAYLTTFDAHLRDEEDGVAECRKDRALADLLDEVGVVPENWKG